MIKITRELKHRVRLVLLPFVKGYRQPSFCVYLYRYTCKHPRSHREDFGESLGYKEVSNLALMDLTHATLSSRIELRSWTGKISDTPNHYAMLEFGCFYNLKSDYTLKKKLVSVYLVLCQKDYKQPAEIIYVGPQYPDAQDLPYVPLPPTIEHSS